MGTESDAAIVEVVVRPAKRESDRLSALPGEIHLIIFAWLRILLDHDSSSLSPLSLPLSVNLNPFQRISLYKKITLRNGRDIRIVDRCLGVSGLGYLVLELVCGITEEEMEDGTIYNNLQDGLSITYLSDITSLDCHGPLSFCFGDEIAHYFPQLQKIKLRIYTPDTLAAILKLEHLKECDFDVDPLSERLEGTKEAKTIMNTRVRQLSLQKLRIIGDLSPQSVLNFLRQVESMTIELITGFSRVIPALNALDASTTNLHVFRAFLPVGSSRELLDAHLERFVSLESFKIGGNGIRLSKTFFTSFLKTPPLIKLVIEQDFPVIVKDLVEALRIDTSAKHLKFIILNNHDEDELKRTLTRTKLIALFKGACNMEDLDNLVSITTSRQILLYGETMVNYQVMQQLALGMSEEEKATMRARELAVETDSERLARREAEIMSLLSEGMTAAHLGGFRYTL